MEEAVILRAGFTSGDWMVTNRVMALAFLQFLVLW